MLLEENTDKKTLKVTTFHPGNKHFPFLVSSYARCWFYALLILHHTSSLTSPRNMKPPTQTWNFSQILGNLPVYALPCQSSASLLRLSPNEEDWGNNCLKSAAPQSQQRDSPQSVSFPKTAKPQESKSNDGPVTTNVDVWSRLGWTVGTDFFPRMGSNNRFRVTDAQIQTLDRTLPRLACKFTDSSLFVA